LLYIASYMLMGTSFDEMLGILVVILCLLLYNLCKHTFVRSY